MACNCNSNPCSCANANCACPPDYSFNPATLICQGTTCEDTLPTACIFTSSYLNCVKTNAGTSLDVVLQAMDAKICACGSCSGTTFPTLAVYYVDSNNPALGDGSVINPFQTIDLAYAKVIGTGTVNSPNHPGVTIQVAAGTYTTGQNIYIPTVTINFSPNAVVTYTGAGTYFIDSSVGTSTSPLFKITGYLDFNTSTGGFVRNVGPYHAGYPNRQIYIEANSILGTSGTGFSAPLIYHNQTYSPSSYSTISTTIILKGPASFIASAAQSTVVSTGGYFYLDLGGGQIGYGVNLNTGVATGLTGNNMINYNSTDVGGHAAQTTFILKNGTMYSINATDAIFMGGAFNTFIIDNVSSVNFGLSYTKSNTFLNIAAINNPGPTEFTFLLKDVYLHPSDFATATVILNSSGQQVPYLNMQNCVLYNNCTISSTIALGLQADNGNTVSTHNVINGKLRITQLPTSSSGLVSGELWNSGGVIHII